jgi:hypothetical protein
MAQEESEQTDLAGFYPFDLLPLARTFLVQSQSCVAVPSSLDLSRRLDSYPLTLDLQSEGSYVM